jgi:DNA-directed RNA polymerase specialized sigma24 family protein
VRSAVSESVLAIEAVGAEELLIAHEEKVSVQAALAELDEPMQQVWQVFFVDQMTTVEGAAALGVSRATATRYKQALREELAVRLAKNVDRGGGGGGGGDDDDARVWK